MHAVAIGKKNEVSIPSTTRSSCTSMTFVSLLLAQKSIALFACGGLVHKRLASCMAKAITIVSSFFTDRCADNTRDCTRGLRRTPCCEMLRPRVCGHLRVPYQGRPGTKFPSRGARLRMCTWELTSVRHCRSRTQAWKRLPSNRSSSVERSAARTSGGDLQHARMLGIRDV